MVDEERDFVTFEDDEGNEFELDVLDYFEHEGQEYAILADLNAQEAAESEDDEHNMDVFIMKVVENGEFEEFVPADDDKFDELVKIAEELLSEECDCDDECDCDCDESSEDGCHCGCHDGDCH